MQRTCGELSWDSKSIRLEFDGVGSENHFPSRVERADEKRRLTITAAQLKAARRLLGWSQDDVAGASGLDTSTIVNFERGKSSLDRAALADIQKTLEAAGVEFVEIAGAAGVKLRNAR
jgi:DNA-binding XRE family transcriptional regulator